MEVPAQQQQQDDDGVESVTAVDSSLTEPSSCGGDSVHPVNDLVKDSGVSRGGSGRGRPFRGSTARGTHSYASKRAHRTDRGDSGAEVVASNGDLARTSKGRDSNAEASSQQHSRPVKTVVCDDHDNSTVRSVKQLGDSLVIRINCSSSQASSSSTTAVGNCVTSDGQVKVRSPAAAAATAKLDGGGSALPAAAVSSPEQSHDSGADSQTAIADDKRMNADSFARNQTSENKRRRGEGKFGRMNRHRGQRVGSSGAAPANLAEDPVAATAGDEEVQRKISEHSATGTPDVGKSDDHGVSSHPQQIETDSKFRCEDTNPASGDDVSHFRGRHRGRGFSAGRRYLRSATRRGRGTVRGAYEHDDSDMLPDATIGSSGTPQTATVDDVRPDSASGNSRETWNDDQRKLSDKPDCVDVSSVVEQPNNGEKPPGDVVSSGGRCYDARYFVRSRRARGAYRGRRAGNGRPFSHSQASAATVGQDGGPSQGLVIVGGEENWDADTIPITVSAVNCPVKDDRLAVELNALSVNASECKDQGVQGDNLTNTRAECVGDDGKAV